MEYANVDFYHLIWLQMILSPVNVLLLHLNMGSEINHFHLVRNIFFKKSGKHLWIDSFYCKKPEGARRQEEQERGFEIVGTSAPDRTLDEVQRRAF